MNKKTSLYIGIVVLVALVGVIVYAIANNYHSPNTNTNSTNNATPSNIAQTNRVVIRNFAFSPESIKVKVGTTVTWTNGDGTVHTITKDDGDGPDSPSIAPGKSYSFTYTKKGTFAYHCSIHPDMTAKVTVE